MSRLLIDGYNLLYAASLSSTPGEHETEELMEWLRAYKKQKGHTISVIFDGYERGMPLERRERIKGIGVIYSKLGEKADQVIERLVREWGGSCVVVTSDRMLADSVERDGAAVLGSEDFLQHLKMSESLEFEGEGEPEGPERGRLDTRKKGNPRRKSKKERARSRRLKKL